MPRGYPKKKRVEATEPKVEMVKMTLELPPELHARVSRAAKEDERTANVFVRRWIAANIDAMDPTGAEGATDA